MDEKMVALVGVHYAHVGALVYACRKAAGMTQRDLAAAAGTSQSCISELETGGPRGNITVATVMRIMEVMGLRLAFSVVPDGKN